MNRPRIHTQKFPQNFGIRRPRKLGLDVASNRIGSGGSYRRIVFRLRPPPLLFPIAVWNLGDQKESFVRFQCELPSPPGSKTTPVGGLRPRYATWGRFLDGSK